MDCLDPPLVESPPGKWHCPMCPPVHDSNLVSILPEPGMPVPDCDGPIVPFVQSHTKTKEVSLDEPGPDIPIASSSKIHSVRKVKGKSKNLDMSVDEEYMHPHQSPKKRKIIIDSPAPVTYPSVKIRLRIPGKSKWRERREDVERRGLFDDILGPEDRDTTRTSIETNDIQRFDKSRVVSEVRCNPYGPFHLIVLLLQTALAPPPVSISIETPGTPGPSSRPLRSSAAHISINTTPLPNPSTSPAPSTPTPHQSAQPHKLRIQTIRFGQFDIQTWYDAPFPEEYATIPDGRLWRCEFCLKYTKGRFGAERHQVDLHLCFSRLHWKSHGRI